MNAVFIYYSVDTQLYFSSNFQDADSAQLNINSDLQVEAPFEKSCRDDVQSEENQKYYKQFFTNPYCKQYPTVRLRKLKIQIDGSIPISVFLVTHMNQSCYNVLRLLYQKVCYCDNVHGPTLRQSVPVVCVSPSVFVNTSTFYSP